MSPRDMSELMVLTEPSSALEDPLPRRGAARGAGAPREGPGSALC